jgi:hypothetical protein
LFYGPNGSTAKIIKSDTVNMMETTEANGTTEKFEISDDKTKYTSKTGKEGKLTIDDNNKKSLIVSNPNGDKIIYSSINLQTNTDTINKGLSNSSSFSNMYNEIKKTDIPKGEEDLYILKSQIIPGLCPITNPQTESKVQTNTCPPFDKNKCPPCPQPRRCPQPSFECKKVLNYNAFTPQTMPFPVINTMQTFAS